MMWLTWRQLRAQLVALALAAAALSTWMLGTGDRVHRLAHTSSSLFDSLSHNDHRLFYAGVVVLAVLPAIVGVFWGAPLVAREIEDGTHRLVWSQGVTRLRWLLTKLGLTALATVAVVGLLSWVVTWWSGPLDGALSQTRGSLPSRMTPVTFAMRGIVPVAWAVLALTLGVLLGLVLRRVLVAMAATLVLVVAAQIAWPILVRPHLVTPRVETVVPTRSNLDGITQSDSGAVSLSVQSPGPGDWVLSQHLVTLSGRAVDLPSSFTACLPPPPAPGTEERATVSATKDPMTQCLGQLATDYRFRVSYQPLSRFWTVQWVETGALLALSLVLAGAAAWRIRRDVG